MKQFLLTFFMILLSVPFFAQELNAKITINTPKLQTADPKVFESLRTAMQEFFNNTRWTEDIYEITERINININMTITEEKSATEFRADFSIQASRPIYGSEQETVIFTHLDNNFYFIYEQFQPLIYTQNSYSDNLTSLLSFYAYIIIGLDYDSFAPYSGEKYFQTAQEIMSNVPEGVKRNYAGWRSIEGNRNRYWLVENLLTPRVQPMRQAWYDYHRLGLDKMHEEPAVGRAIMLQSLETVQSVDKTYPNSMLIQVFSNSKGQELIDVFSQGTREEKTRVVDIMTKIDAANSRKFSVLRS